MIHCFKSTQPDSAISDSQLRNEGQKSPQDALWSSESDLFRWLLSGGQCRSRRRNHTVIVIIRFLYMDSDGQNLKRLKHKDHAKTLNSSPKCSKVNINACPWTPKWICPLMIIVNLNWLRCLFIGNSTKTADFLECDIFWLQTVISLINQMIFHSLCFEIISVIFFMF